jgi:L,D-peptidoglycan transpeptidase YkuD (ErfK/YbiS/YcfS/YnhG family)
VLAAPGLTVPCALGRTGVTHAKREGDGATPAGWHRGVEIFYRRDRMARPATRLPVAAILPDLGWCDDPADRRYNRPVRLPFPASHERLWRDDGLYDLVVVLDCNLARPVPGRGSAIFVHVAAPGLAPTAGCIAIGLDALRRLVARLGPATVIAVR